jgi:MarR family transcriptional regulator, organic hydroperoxide resistance regulator
MTRTRDFLAAQGSRAFGTRLRRLYETLNQGVATAYAQAGVDFEPRWFGLMSLVLAQEEVDIGTAAAALGQSHVAVVQVANALESRGLIRRVAPKADRRSRVLRMTAKGKALCEKLAPLWDAVAAATQSLLDEAAPHFLKELDALDWALARTPLSDRIKHRSRS